MTEPLSHPLQGDAEYKRLRASLIRVFQAAGLADAENLADEVISRVLASIEGGTEVQSVRDYAQGIAKNVRSQEFQRLKREREIAASAFRIFEGSPVSRELEGCLSHCLGDLASEDRELLGEYYARDGRAGIEQHRALERKLSLTPEALAMRVFRLRKKLLKCILECRRMKSREQA
jgi:DNA-directed RNA polymerase specialized sigma24 family protein